MSPKEPRVLYEPVLLSEAGDIDFQAGAFADEREAERVLDMWRAEGRTEEMAINLVPVYDTAEEWREDQ